MKLVPYGVTSANDLVKFGSVHGNHGTSRRSRKAARSRARQTVRRTLRRYCCR